MSAVQYKGQDIYFEPSQEMFRWHRERGTEDVWHVSLAELKKRIDKELAFKPVEVYRWRHGFNSAEDEAELFTVTAKDFRSGGWYGKDEEGRREKAYFNEELYAVTPENEALFREMESYSAVIKDYQRRLAELQKRLTLAELPE